MMLNKKILVLHLTDAVLMCLSFFVSTYLCTGAFPVLDGKTALILAFITVFGWAFFYFFTLYSRVWRQASIYGFMSITKGVTVFHAFLLTAAILIPHSEVGIRVVATQWFVMMSLVGGVRFARRIWQDRQSIIPLVTAKEQINALIVGAGNAGAIVGRELKKHPELAYNLVGFLDDDESKQNRRVVNIPVLGKTSEIKEMILEHDVQEVIIAIPSVSGSFVRKIVSDCQALKVKLKIIPGVYELLEGSVNVSKIRNVEIEDLLGREPVKANVEEIASYLTSKKVLVTGAGGSIGSELCRQIAPLNPAQLIILGQGENSIFQVEMELRRNFPGLLITPIIADIKDQDKLEKVFFQYRPEVVFHAAAHKHVPLMEQNPEEAVKNNIMGTRNLAELADKYSVRKFVLISTDKAVNPTSVMGSTKRVAELVIQNLARKSATKFAAVRFGNVLGSRGSVIPIFKQQIARGGPVTVTHPEMTRYFMTIPEASQLVIQAGAMANGGEIFILDMGSPVKIVDLARNLIKLSGFEPDEEIKIEFSGVRPGEKLYEELLTAEEGTCATRHKRIFVAKPTVVDEAWLTQEIEELIALAKEVTRLKVVEKLKKIIDTTNTSSTVSNVEGTTKQLA